MAAAIRMVRAASSSQPVVRLAFEFLVLTAVRSGEARLAMWTEINMADRVWTTPALRMKAKREHRVPLCGRALELLDAARKLGDGNRLVFPMRSGKAVAASTLPKMPGPSGRRGRPRLPFQLPGLSGRGDRPPARGHRGGACPCRCEPRRGGLCAVGPVRAAATADGRLGGVPRWPTDEQRWERGFGSRRVASRAD